ncbi:MAG: hypothetical protein HUU28_17525 [Planctomycetaceae bacterium]|jgi:hypothetical protein|nr:hypothetical protein [Planctomycetaceae bacterium]
MKTLGTFAGVVLIVAACRAAEPTVPAAPPQSRVESPTVIQIRTLGQSENHLGGIWLQLKANGEFERIDEGFPRGERRTSGVVPVRLIDVWRGRWERLKSLKPPEALAVCAEEAVFVMSFDGEGPVEIPWVPPSLKPGTPVVSVAVLHEHELHALMMRIFDSTTAATASR